LEIRIGILGIRLSHGYGALIHSRYESGGIDEGCRGCGYSSEIC
jgi:hypothetical protein